MTTRPVDEEYSQALARVAWGAAALVISVVFGWIGWTSAPAAIWTTAAVGAYLLFACVWAVVVKRTPGEFIVRRVILLLGDLGMTTFGISLLDELGAIFYPLYLWIIVGYGMRYGPRYMYVAIVAGAGAFAVVLATNAFWREHITLGITLWIGLLALPLFYLTLIRRLHGANMRLANNASELRSKNAELDTFVYTVTHDLKSPLVAIQGMVSLLLEKESSGLDGDDRRYLQRIQVNVLHMEHLLRDLLALAHVGRGARVPEAVPLGAVVAELTAELAETLRVRGIKVTVGDLPTVSAVRVEIEQVVRNLMTNAVKYMGEAAAPEIEIGAVDRGDAIECFVRDTGIGIDPAYHETIFELFQRLKEVDVEGTGVGLPIVKKIVEGEGGRVWVESAPGRGATFRFTWPKRAQGPPRP